MPAKRFLGLLLIPAALALGGCQKLVLLHPAGLVAQEQSHLMIVSTIILLSIIVPVLIAVAIVAWKYRASNKKARYDAKWDHSPVLELFVWAWPVLIILAVGALSWIGTHQLDPYRPLTDVAKGEPVPANVKPLQVEVVALQWQWLFIYPQYGVASINELAAPINRPITFKITSLDGMDSFFIPALAGQIYAMPEMQTQLHGVINKVGVYKGMSANYSGAGFTDMRFKFYGMTKDSFNGWVAKVKASPKDLDRATYEELIKPVRNGPVQYFGTTQKGLFNRIVNRCVDPANVCKSTLMARDAKTGLNADKKNAMGGMSMPAGKAADTVPATAH
ncbi:MAG TPA: ubiquinol oxidase subunit II [Rhodanobacteraceae bacterium]